MKKLSLNFETLRVLTPEYTVQILAGVNNAPNTYADTCSYADSCTTSGSTSIVQQTAVSGIQPPTPSHVKTKC